MTEIETGPRDHVSPYLPGTNIQYAWDSTSLGLLKTCPRLYQLTMIEGWSNVGDNIHLRFGQEYHKALEDFDKFQIIDGLSRAEAVKETITQTWQRVHDWEVDTDTKAGKYKNKESLLRTILDYLDHYNPDPAQTFVLNDGSPAVELSFRFELDWGPKSAYEHKIVGREVWDTGAQELVVEPTDVVADEPRQPYLLSGHLDRVVTQFDDLYVMDRKTTLTTPGQYFFDQFAPNNQMTLYTLASRVVLHAPVKGVIIDAGQILIDSSSFKRGFTYRTEDQINEWVGDLEYWFSLSEQFAINNYWPMNDTACDKFGGCKFRGICSKSPNVRNIHLKGSFTQLPLEERWNPLKPR